MVDYGESGVAKFNMGLATTMAIRELLDECNTASRMGKFTIWFNTLRTIEREVRMKKFSEKDDKLMNEGLINLQKIVINAKGKLDNNALVFDALHKYEVILRQMIQKKGMGMPDDDDASLAIFN